MAVQTFPKFKLTSILFAGFVIALGTTSTQAGFEWIPPKQAPQVTQPVIPAPIVSPPPVQSAPILPGYLPAPAPLAAPAAPPPQLNTNVSTVGTTRPLAGTAPETFPVPGPIVEPVIIAAPPQNAPVALSAPVQALEPRDYAPAPAPVLDAPPVLYTPPSLPAAPVIKRQRIIIPSDAPSNVELNTPGGVTRMPSPDGPLAAQAIESFVSDPYVPNTPPAVLNIPAPPPATVASGGIVISPRPLGETPLSVASPAAPAPVFVAPPPAPMITQEAVGFGNDIPLALAVQQVVPSEFAYSFDPAVDVATRVSWSGGRPWNLVAADMIAPFGYSLVIRGNVVHIAAGGAVPFHQTRIIEAVPAIQPASGADDPQMTEAVRERNVKRMAVIDPGAETQASQPKSAIEAIFSN